jgi:hypothetical protein
MLGAAAARVAGALVPPELFDTFVVVAMPGTSRPSYTRR